MLQLMGVGSRYAGVSKMWRKSMMITFFIILQTQIPIRYQKAQYYECNTHALLLTDQLKQDSNVIIVFKPNSYLFIGSMLNLMRDKKPGFWWTFRAKTMIAKRAGFMQLNIYQGEDETSLKQCNNMQCTNFLK